MKTTRVFIHGLDGSSRGVKGEFFRKRYPLMIIGDFTGDLAGRMDRLNAVLGSKTDLILVGSSYGGLMASLFACENEGRMTKMILLAPAIGLPEFSPFLDCRLSIPVTVIHGSRDEVLPLDVTRTVSGRVFLNCTFNVVDDDHSLHHTFGTLDWDALLDIP